MKNKMNKKKEIICKKCEQLKPHYCLGICKICYMEIYRKKNKKQIAKKRKEHYEKREKFYCQEKKKQIAKYNHIWYKKNKERIFKKNKNRYHNIIDGEKRTIINHGKPYIVCRGGKFIHRVIAEKAISRRLRRDEIVHHLDENTLNNKNSNLIVCSRSYHTWLHEHKYKKEA